jgi:hypothetical protein
MFANVNNKHSGDMEEQMHEILMNLNRGRIAVSEAQDQLLDLFNMTRSYGIVRWRDNEHDDVVCVNRATAEQYVKKYNELAGWAKCYVDDDIWLPLNEA